MNLHRALPVAAVLLAGSLVAACAPKTPDAPTDVGVCWHVIFLKDAGKPEAKDGGLKFNKLASNQPNLETCAATLEGMRLRFRSFGGSEEIVGAYQGNYLFIQRPGVFTSRTLTGGRYVALVRSGDGRLVIPGAVRQAKPTPPE